MYGVYLIVLLLALTLSIPSCLFALNLAPPPPFIQSLGPLRPIIVGGIALLGFLFLVVASLENVFPMSIWAHLAFRIHFLVVVAALAEFWLELRRRRNLPVPFVELRW
jgi:hypothetical protein